MNSSVPLEISAMRGFAGTQEADEFVDFWEAGSTAKGVFSCVACGRTIGCASRLPACPSCDGRLWEAAWSSPFAYSGMPLATRLHSLERWKTD